MNYDEFRDLVQALEKRATAGPGAYRARVVALATLGFVAVAASLLTILAVVGALAAFSLWTRHGLVIAKSLKIIIPLVLLGYGFVKATWMSVPPPRGILLRREEHPKLFALIDRARNALGVEEPDVVLLDSDMNAGVAEVPRFGLFPVYRTYLVLGLPLLEALTETELEAVLVHEFGHLSNRHGRLTSWIYRIRRAWYLIAAQVEERGAPAGALLQRFVGWYVPRLGAWSFPLARANEYDADADAARATSPQSLVDALVRIRLAAATADDRFWSALGESIRSQATPPRGSFARLAAMLHEAPDPSWSNAQLSRFVAIKTEFHDTHPALADRAAALGVEPRTPPPVATPASEAVLDKVEFVRERVSHEWYENIAEIWAAQHKDMQEAANRLESLELRATQLDADEQAERARLALQLGENEVAAEALRYFVDRPDEQRHFSAVLELGKLTLLDDPVNGRALIERAIAGVPELESDGAEALAAHYQGRDEVEYAKWRDRMHRAVDRDAGAQAERDGVDSGSELQAHDLDIAQLDAVRRHLREDPDVKQAWISRKVLQHYPDRPLYVVAIKITGRFKADRDGLEREYAQIQRRIAETIPLPGEGIVLQVNTNGWLKSKSKSVAEPLL